MAGVLIRSYGELWSPDLVNWGKKGPGGKAQMAGEFRWQKRKITVDVWEQRGVYVLLHDWQVVYVGKAGGTPLGVRLRGHLTDTLAGRWDRFSWYGIRSVNVSGLLGAEMEGKQVTATDLISTFESLLIAVTEPPRNRRREEIPGARIVVQAGREPPRALASYIDEVRRTQHDIIEQLANLVAVSGPP